MPLLGCRHLRLCWNLISPRTSLWYRSSRTSHPSNCKSTLESSLAPYILTPRMLAPGLSFILILNALLSTDSLIISPSSKLGSALWWGKEGSRTCQRRWILRSSQSLAGYLIRWGIRGFLIEWCILELEDIAALGFSEVFDFGFEFTGDFVVLHELEFVSLGLFFEVLLFSVFDLLHFPANVLLIEFDTHILLIRLHFNSPHRKEIPNHPPIQRLHHLHRSQLY